MYCRNCGKKLPDDSNELLCEDCKKLETEPFAEFEQHDDSQPEQQPINDNSNKSYNNYNNYNQNGYNQNNYNNQNDNPRMLGFGKALASTIMSVFGYFFSIASFQQLTGSTSFFIGLLVSLVLLCISLGLSIPSLVMGIKSIKTFASVKNSQSKPVATLVLGIIGTSFSGFAIFIASITLFAMTSYLMLI
jgi:hypothetical protein